MFLRECTPPSTFFIQLPSSWFTEIRNAKFWNKIQNESCLVRTLVLRPTDSTTTTAVTADDNRKPPPSSSDEDFFSSASVASSSSSDENPPLPPPKIPISWPSDGILSRDWVMDLMTAFDWGSRNLPPSEFPSILPVQVFDSLILSASKILHKEPNCVRIDSGNGADSRVVVVGDVHGQLHDVIFLLRDAGFSGG
ncbi:serine/threonine-protein phosphatase 7 long form-like protein [Actinidia rufa]|uniref:Serine/threonine-protein phosphatase 7 long form-like protein n=1 Tax=Actinidia rufa TaxID=165716 RepID=A0A7J0EMX3_9ERIC|nr:serine/threonine-protein phosphatase 7 long form-like protein [Actinidia rufa]